jgi:hypothetical protein
MVEAGTADITMGRVRMVEGREKTIFGNKLVIINCLPAHSVAD